MKRHDQTERPLDPLKYRIINRDYELIEFFLYQDLTEATKGKTILRRIGYSARGCVHDQIFGYRGMDYEET